MTLRNPAFSDARTWPAAWDRLAIEMANLQAGVLNPGDLKVTAAAAGGQRVDIAAGTLLTKGDSGIPSTGISQGLFIVVNDAPVANAVSLAASNATLPRIDQIVVRVRDDALAGGGNDSTFMVLTGVAVAGATLDNRNGATALPADYERLADVLVPASSTAVTTGNIRDRRGWARGAYSSRAPSGAGNYAVVALNSVLSGDPLNTRLECSGVSPIDMRLWVSGAANLANPAYCNFTVDGIVVSYANFTRDASGAFYGSFPFTVPVTAGSHEFNVKFSSSGGGMSISRDTSPPLRPIFTVQEVMRASATSGFDFGARN